MKPVFLKRFFFMCCLILVCCCFPASAQTARQTVVFSNPGKSSGKVYVAFYNKEADFLKKDKIFISKTVEIHAKAVATISFENIALGTYAIAAFLDENGNGKMDTNFFGIPKEKYGFSNNIRPMMRAATFKEAAFVVAIKESAIHIKLK
ncbi:MAG: DUF2141 domain-containing protein [Chitinophagaceae bacterium]